MCRHRVKVGGIKYFYLLKYIERKVVCVCACVCVHKVSNGFLGVSNDREFACNTGNLGSVPGSGRSPEEGNGYPHKCSCLENSMDRGAWQATVYGVTKSWTRLND